MRSDKRSTQLKRQVLTVGSCLVSLAALGGCSDDEKNTTETGDPGTLGDETKDIVQNIVPASADGHDRFFGNVIDSQGNIYTVGNVADSTAATADFGIVVSKFISTGTLDTTFGVGGFARHNLVVGTNGETARNLALQSDGKIVVVATIEHVGAADARDRDLAVCRLNTDGTLDTSFGTNGKIVLDLSDGEVVGSGYVADSAWGIKTYSDNRLIVTGAMKRAGFQDTDFAVVRLSAHGVVDTTFGDNGVASVDVNEAGASPRSPLILEDGHILMGGYTTTSGVTTPVVFKLDSTGHLDTSFGVNGVYNEQLYAIAVEVYAIALQGTSLITVGYGRNAETENVDWLSLRLSANGVHDMTYGTNGIARVDIGGFNDNGRNLLVLPNGHVLLIGGGRTSETNLDAAVAMLDENGHPDTTFSDNGVKTFDFGGAADMLWGGALDTIHKHAAIAGARAVGTGNPGNDDAALVLVPVSMK